MTNPPAPGAFSYSNLSERMTGRFLRILRKILPGVDKVEREIAPYAANWHEHNIAALGSTDPLWVVLGDSISQGIGASSIEQGWVLRTQRALVEQGMTFRVLNLSISGARVADVVAREIPAMNGLGITPALVTVFIGSNDIIRRDLRAAIANHYEEMLALLPKGSLVAVTGGDRGALGEINRIVAAASAAGDVVAVPVRFAPNSRAEDHFHPNDAGYALIAEDFTAAIAARLG